MPLDNAGSHQARSASDDNWPLPSPSTPATGALTSTPQRTSVSTYAFNAAHTNFSSPNRARSRSSTVTSLTPSSRPGSGVAVSDYRDVLTPIPDDPFSRRGDPQTDRHAEVDSDSDDYLLDSDDSDTDETVGNGNASTIIETISKPATSHSYIIQTTATSSTAAAKPKPTLPSRRDSLRTRLSYFPNSNTPSMENYNIAVIGATGVGKTSFVQRVMGLGHLPFSNATSMRFPIDNTSHMITLLELDLDFFELNPSNSIRWPKQVNGHIVPRVDAALVLYDVLNHMSIRDLPQAIAALRNSKIPSILVACKCEHSRERWEVDADGMANHVYFKSCLAHYKLHAKDPDAGRACLRQIVKAATASRKVEEFVPVFRKRAPSVAVPDTTPPGSQGNDSSEPDVTLIQGFPDAPLLNHARAKVSRESLSTTPPNTATPSPGYFEEPKTGHSFNTILRTSGVPVATPSPAALLDVEESDADSYRDSVDIPILQRGEDSIGEKQPKLVGVSFDELVDRLLALRLSRADNNFSDVFLCLYRKFAAPGQLFAAILRRLEQNRDDKTAHYLSKTATQLRIIEVVAKWVSLYPGDFARPMTRRNLEDFINYLTNEPIFAIAAQHMRRNLNLNVVEDDDTGWSNSDETSEKVASQILHNDIPRHISSSTIHFDDEMESRQSGLSDTSTLDRNNSISSQFQLHSLEEYDREAAYLEPTEQLPMNKFRYHIFMDISDDDIADEMTRIDWIMFSSIRIRDFVRHVSLNSAEKEKCKSLKNVNRMISHFNHIAKWVANLILLRDKAKHRALMLEKFMNIALKLRQLNNYNGLAAVLAGINGTAIHRLAQTRSLVSIDVQKRFARLVILMGTQKSHSAYRLAWENSPLPRIPFIPLHRRDLVSAEEGSKTLIGERQDRINWKKFEVLGDVLLPIMKSQGTAYPNLVKHDAARELVLDCRMPTDDEEIYQRSIQLESSSTNAMDSTKKKFPWFAK